MFFFSASRGKSYARFAVMKGGREVVGLAVLAPLEHVDVEGRERLRRKENRNACFFSLLCCVCVRASVCLSLCVCVCFFSFSSPVGATGTGSYGRRPVAET